MAHILIVDDEHDVAVLLKFLMEKDGHRVSTARHGGEAMVFLGVEPERLDTEIPDLILLDVMMPVMDGCAVATRLAGHDRLKGIPLIVLTAKKEMRSLFQKLANVASYMDKPFDPQILRTTVAGILSRKK